MDGWADVDEGLGGLVKMEGGCWSLISNGPDQDSGVMNI